MRGSNGYYLARQHQADAEDFAIKMAPIIEDIMVRERKAPTMERTAERLNALGLPTHKGLKWYPATVFRILKILGPDFRARVRHQRRMSVAAALVELEMKLSGLNVVDE